MKSKKALIHVEQKLSRWRGTDPAVIAELKELAQLNQGLLKAEDVVEAARDASSPLHDKFEWDDSEAAERYRLIQARLMINVSVQYLPTANKKAIPTKVFVSLSTDRYGQNNESAGYRQLIDVLADHDLKTQLLQDSLEQMTRFQERYKSLKELDSVFMIMEETKKKLVNKK